jgi:hypothetical protein
MENENDLFSDLNVFQEHKNEDNEKTNNIGDPFISSETKIKGRSEIHNITNEVESFSKIDNNLIEQKLELKNSVNIKEVNNERVVKLPEEKPELKLPENITEDKPQVKLQENLNGFKNEIFSESVKLMETLGFKLDSMLISCLYYNIRCTANDFYLYTTYDNGNCFIYNFEPKTKNTKVANPKLLAECEDANPNCPPQPSGR